MLRRRALGVPKSTIERLYSQQSLAMLFRTINVETFNFVMRVGRNIGKVLYHSEPFRGTAEFVTWKAFSCQGYRFATSSMRRREFLSFSLAWYIGELECPPPEYMLLNMCDSVAYLHFNRSVWLTWSDSLATIFGGIFSKHDNRFKQLLAVCWGENRPGSIHTAVGQCEAELTTTQVHCLACWQ